MKAVAGLLVRHTVFYEAFSLPLLIAVFLHIAITPLLLCVSRHLCLWQSQESVFMPSAWRSHLHTSLKRSWGHPVGFSLLPVRHIKGLLECGHLPSVSHVPAIACAFALRKCISLVSQPFPAQLYLSRCPAMWFPEYVWGSICEHIQHFLLVCTHCPRLTSIKQSAGYTGIVYIDFDMLC